MYIRTCAYNCTSLYSTPNRLSAIIDEFKKVAVVGLSSTHFVSNAESELHSLCGRLVFHFGKRKSAHAAGCALVSARQCVMMARAGRLNAPRGAGGRGWSLGTPDRVERGREAVWGT